VYLSAPEAASFQSRVADFYRSRGYVVHESARVRGASESVWAVQMVAEGPLGALLISFGDAAGVDGPEIGRVKAMAKDIGATPTIAAPEMSAELRRLAAQYGVVVVDDTALEDPMPNLPAPVAAAALDDPLRRALEEHPWPASGRSNPADLRGDLKARDVDDMMTDLRQAGAFSPPRRAPVAPVAPATPVASPQVVAPPSAAPASPHGGAPPSTAKKFGWLGVQQMAAALQPPAPLATPGSAPTDVMTAPAAQPVSILEQDATLEARNATLGERAMDAASAITARPRIRWTVILATLGAILLFFAIRWFAA
jgi:hypothetical protein